MGFAIDRDLLVFVIYLESYAERCGECSNFVKPRHVLTTSTLMRIR
jgi:hypothetical protein